MSTNVEHARPNRTDPTTDDPDADSTATSHTEPPTATSHTEPPTARASPAATDSPATSTGSTPSDAGADSWTRRCQRQFDARATDRLANLVDEENLVVVSPGGE